MIINDVLTVLGILNIVAMVVLIISSDAGFSFVNPVVIYNNIKVNIFGAIVLAIFANAIFPLISVLYWMYKLCTVGRK